MPTIQMEPKNISAISAMQAMVYHPSRNGAAKASWEAMPMPKLQSAEDAIVRMTTSTICGTDLHILKGDVPDVTDGRILGHEGVGVIEQIGPGVTQFLPGDHVIISCITACMKCDFCRKGMPSHCRSGGWNLGHTIDGTQAEYVRIPHADGSLHHFPEDGNEEAFAMLSDILPTGFECGVLNGQVKPGDTIAIVGAGPIGLASLMTAQFYSPEKIFTIDIDDNRLDVAKQLGADAVINSSDGNTAARLLNMTGGDGVDLAIEAVGVPATFDICQAILAPGGRLANIGVHGRPVTLQLEKLWDRNISLTTRLVDTVTVPMLLKAVKSGRLQPAKLVTHRFALSDIQKAYETFANAAHERALKVALINGSYSN